MILLNEAEVKMLITVEEKVCATRDDVKLCEELPSR
jgi:hypothetical protein